MQKDTKMFLLREKVSGIELEYWIAQTDLELI
jgi:hypothetical protein